MCESVDFEFEVDYVVVGSGVGGVSVVVILVCGGVEVVIVEVGVWCDLEDYLSFIYGVMCDFFDDWGM